MSNVLVILVLIFLELVVLCLQRTFGLSCSFDADELAQKRLLFPSCYLLSCHLFQNFSISSNLTLSVKFSVRAEWRLRKRLISNAFFWAGTQYDFRVLIVTMICFNGLGREEAAG